MSIEAGPGGRRDRVVRRRYLTDRVVPEPRGRGERVADAVLAAALGPVLPAFRARNPLDRVVVTYDDGPHPEHTPRILDVLAEHRTRATFFVLAGPARRHPHVVRRAVAEGHEIALHGADHGRLTRLSTRAAVSSVLGARRAVEDVAQVPVRFFRPPYGASTLRVNAALRARGLDVVLWTAEAKDWLHDDEHTLAQNALATLRPGAFLLLHDDRADPELATEPAELPHFDRAEVLRGVLTGMAAAGLRAATVGDVRPGGVLRSYGPDLVR
ncbi:polysaccharide deacetylase family protein [Cellulosimicrobium arenosum]|uniref:Polysaccharide deacetylase family protein n=1 Tax=Cellulosimicrobium arenosum TaxID=2708133 RepID=A0A927G9B6_9MICO|nr:polysaccharide deacetylase family protein [Cellulosimicrobium arenosum]MBD8078949.1 polysaccharide deacetylase family protein [Cellulosimicrobium arenosum]